MQSITNILGYIVSGYPYFSLVYVVFFFKKIKTEKSYFNVIPISNFIFLTLSSAILIPYLLELFTAWYSGNMYESYAFANRASGMWTWKVYFTLFVLNLFLPQVFWFKKIRNAIFVTVLVSVYFLLSFWLEPIILFITSFSKDYLPSHWVYKEPWYVRNILTPLLQTISYGFVVLLFVLIKVKGNKIRK